MSLSVSIIQTFTHPMTSSSVAEYSVASAGITFSSASAPVWFLCIDSRVEITSNGHNMAVLSATTASQTITRVHVKSSVIVDPSVVPGKLGKIKRRIGCRIRTMYTRLSDSAGRRPGVKNKTHGRRRSVAVRSIRKEYNALNQGSLCGVVTALRSSLTYYRMV